MTLFVKPATKIQQGAKTLLATSFTVADFRTKNPEFFRINRLDPENETGFQRLLQEERANRLAKYAIEAWKSDENHVHSAFLPTSVFLATEKDIAFDASSNQMHFDHADVCPFDVVDGQHRIMGLLRAVEQVPDLAEFPIAVNIAVNASAIEQMLHFYIVNMTQKAVDPAVGQRIRSRFFTMLKTETLPYIPSWIRRQIESGVDYDAVGVIDFLNSYEGAPWRGKIQLSNQKREGRHTVTQKSFVTALKKSIIKEEHPLMLASGDKEERNRIFANYWSAVAEVFTSPEHEDTVVFKSIGALFFSRVSSAVITIANASVSYTREDFIKIFRDSREDMPGELLGLMEPAWWASGGEASNMNSGAAEKKAVEFNRVIMQAGRSQKSKEA